MRRLFAVILMLLGSVGVASAQTLNCERAFTRMEQAICGNSALLDNYVQLNGLTDRAIADDALSLEAADEFKNKLARACRASDDLEHCLGQEISTAVAVLSGVTSLPESTGVNTPAEQLLRSNVAFADKMYRNTGDPEPIVVALLALLQHYERAATTPTTIAERSALTGRLLKGCRNLSSRRQWNRVLQTYGWSCPLNYASNDFE